jgi:siroheme synthase
MGAASIGGIAAKLAQAGLAADAPVLIIAEGTTPRERRVLTRLNRVATEVAAAKFAGPVLFLIGRVAALSPDGAAACLAVLPLHLASAEAAHA